MVKRFLKICSVSALSLILLTSSAFAVTGTVTGNNVRIRERADAKSYEISVASKGEKVDVIGDEGNWYKVNFEKVTGYISKDYVSTDYVSGSSTTGSSSSKPSTTTETQPEQPASPTSSTNTAGSEQPATQANTASSEQPSSSDNTTVLDNSAGTDTSTPETPSNSAPDTASETPAPEVKENQKVTFENETDLKYLPSFTSRTSTKTASGSTYTVKASLNNWIKVENETNSGWVLKINSSTPTSEQPSSNPSDSTSSSDSSTSDTSLKKGTVIVESARIRKTPDGEHLDSIKEGTEVTIIGEEGEWYKINVDDYEGCYIAKRLIKEK